MYVDTHFKVQIAWTEAAYALDEIIAFSSHGHSTMQSTAEAKQFLSCFERGLGKVSHNRFVGKKIYIRLPISQYSSVCACNGRHSNSRVEDTST